MSKEHVALRDQSIKSKLTSMVMLTSGAALIMACLGFALYDYFTFREEKVRELSSFAEIIAASSAKSLNNMDADAAGEIVGSLPGDRNILAACLYSMEGKLLTGFVSQEGSEGACPEGSPVYGHEFTGSTLSLAHPAVLAGKTAGTVLLVSGLDDMWSRMIRYSAISGIVLLASILVAFVSSARLRKVISDPILKLAKTARAISNQQDFSVRVERNSGGEVGLLTDSFNEMLTQIQRRDEELRKAKGDLEQRFEEKKSQLKVEADGRLQAEVALKESEDALRQSQKMEAIGRLAGGVAHDFNNLLTGIMGYTDMLVASLKDGDPLKSHVGEIRKASHRAADLTRQLLAFSRKQILEPKVLNLNWIVSNLEKMLQRLIGEDVELVTVTGEELGRIKADPGQIEQVILNLAVNARDAMPEGGRLAIETANLVVEEGEESGDAAWAEPGSYVMLQISDTGVGMDEETRTRVFEPFFTTKGEGKGTGLGLSTVYGIVTQSEGTVSVHSRPGEGTTFRILLPLVTQEADTLVEFNEECLKSGSETILLVEDEQLVRDLTRTILVTHGYKILEAPHGGEALKICEEYEGPIHLMLTDVVMPNLSGPALRDRVASMRPEMSVLFMSGYTGMLDSKEGKINEGDPFIQKPFTPVALASKIREVLGKPAPAEEELPGPQPLPEVPPVAVEPQIGEEIGELPLTDSGTQIGEEIGEVPPVAVEPQIGEEIGELPLTDSGTQIGEEVSQVPLTAPDDDGDVNPLDVPAEEAEEELVLSLDP